MWEAFEAAWAAWAAMETVVTQAAVHEPAVMRKLVQEAGMRRAIL